MPPFDYYNRHYNYGISFAPDSDNHLRFTLVDIKGEEKKFDIDLNLYTNMYHKVWLCRARPYSCEHAADRRMTISA